VPTAHCRCPLPARRSAAPRFRLLPGLGGRELTERVRQRIGLEVLPILQVVTPEQVEDLEDPSSRRLRRA